MNDLESVKQRLLREEPKKRFAHLAADFLRIANFIESDSAEAAKPIIRESKWFAEWIAPQTDLRTQQFLAIIQSTLALKELQWHSWIENVSEVQATAATVRRWSDDLLKQSGLLD